MAPESEAPGPEAPQPPRGVRTHPATALVRVWVWLVAGAVGSWQSIGQDRPSWTFVLILGVAVVVGVAAGGAAWWFTRYVIDGTELRIDSGVVTKRSRRIPYERLQSVDIAQPFAARILGLAELRIEMAGGEDAQTRLQYLRYDDARSLRRVLLDRAASGTDRAPRAETGTGAGVEPDAGAAAATGTGTAATSLIASVPPHRLILGTLVSAEFLAPLAITGVLLAGANVLDLGAATLSALVPFAGWVVRIVSTRVIAEWGFTLARRTHSLRIERGLLSRSSQTVPFDRLQGVAIEQPLIWRRLGWSRLKVDVAGYAGSSDSGSVAPSTLLPVGRPAQVATVIAEVLPGVDPDAVTPARAPRRSAWLAPVGWRYRGAGAGDAAFVTSTGWIVRSQAVVPHRKSQSVALRQGPLQRRLRLASVSVHSPDGPVHAQGRNLDAEDARRLAYGQLARARTGRGRPA